MGRNLNINSELNKKTPNAAMDGFNHCSGLLYTIYLNVINITAVTENESYQYHCICECYQYANSAVLFSSTWLPSTAKTCFYYQGPGLCILLHNTKTEFMINIDK